MVEGVPVRRTGAAARVYFNASVRNGRSDLNPRIPTCAFSEHSPSPRRPRESNQEDLLVPQISGTNGPRDKARSLKRENLFSLGKYGRRQHTLNLRPLRNRRERQGARVPEEFRQDRNRLSDPVY